MRAYIFLLLSVGIVSTAASEHLLQAQDLPPLPVSVTNNAVTTVATQGGQYVVSFSGLGSGKTHADVHSRTFVLDDTAMTWTEGPPVPGGVGRLASAAATIGDLAYVFGGYTVAEDGSEVSTPWVHAFDPINKSFTELAAMPVPVDDSLALSFADRYIYLISGWHDLANVNLVQRYDTETDGWSQATPLPGSAVFGHAGGIVGNRIVYCDGVRIRAHADRRRDYVATDECYLGIIEPDDSRSIDWRALDPHPGTARYRAAAAGIPAHNGVLFLGGTDNPYNFDGIGYDGRVSEPLGGGLLFDLDSLSWRILSQADAPSMDHRALVPLGNQWLTVGGMLAGQNVSRYAVAYTIVTDID